MQYEQDMHSWMFFLLKLSNFFVCQTSTTLCPKKVVNQTHGDNFVNS